MCKTAILPVRHNESTISRYSRAFTLVELLVVISIIALLLSILMPALSKARESAKSVICRSNGHQIALAMQAYLNGNNYKFYEYLQRGVGSLSPADRDYGQGGIPANLNVKPDHKDYDRLKDWKDWRPINQFITSFNFWKCPSDRGIEVTYTGMGYTEEHKPTIWSNPYYGASYLFNTAGIQKVLQISGKKVYLNPNPNVQGSALKIKNTSKFVIFFEYPFWEVNRYPVQSDKTIGWYGYGLGGKGNFHEPDLKKTSATVMFADGHVSRLDDFTGQGKSGTSYTLVQE